MTQPIVWNNFGAGIADSPHLGNALIRNADIESFPGAVKVSKKPQNYFPTITTQTFTANAGTDICTTVGGVEASNNEFGGAAVYFTTTGTLPAGITTGTVYFLIKVSNTTFKVATSYQNSVGSSAGTAIDITDTGTGTHTINQIGIGTINWIVNDPRNSYKYFLSSNGRTWFVPSGTTAYLLLNSAIESVAGSLTNASGNGLAIHPFSSTTATYLFVFRNNAIDVINVFGNTEIEALSWTNGWQTMNTGTGTANGHHAIVAQDNFIYFCDDRYVGYIKEASGATFAPGTGATYLYEKSALDLPSREIAQCLEELGTILLIGGNTYNKIYPWDRVSDSFNLPIEVPEYNIKRLKNIGGTVYILAGSWGNIYITQGTYARPFKKIPIHLTNNGYSISANPITWGGVAATNNALIFGVGGTTSGSSGVYKLYEDGRLVHDNTPSTGSANVVGLWAQNDFYIMGYSGGADNFQLLSQYSNFETVLQSPFYKVANGTEKGAFHDIEIVIAKIQSSSYSVKVSYRVDTLASFTQIGSTQSFTSADTSTIKTIEDIGLTDLENVQFQVETSGSIELVELRFIP